MKKIFLLFQTILLLTLTTTLNTTLIHATSNNPVKLHQTTQQTLYITKTGKKYHQLGCRYLSRSSIKISRENAERYYSACKVCQPG